MAPKAWIVALALMAAASPISATSPDPVAPTAPPGTPETEYCMKVDPATGSRIETIKCWTREQWAEQGVDVDKEWPREGVSIKG
jgi:hypothetical protein